ncbi:hypothetical protein TNCV_1871591 [Trichonephila clavipes]|nr:hypothetical protein TNCV_1871591 [Trichonephila clavipes]
MFEAMQLPMNSFHGYGVLKVGIHLGCYLRECSLTFSGKNPLQHSYITVLLLRNSLAVVLRRRHLTQEIEEKITSHPMKTNPVFQPVAASRRNEERRDEFL